MLHIECVVCGEIYNEIMIMNTIRFYRGEENGIVKEEAKFSESLFREQYVQALLAIDMEYSFYSPGYVLLCETMKYVIPNTSIRNIDLCRGTEKYKTDMGGGNL